jgi:RHS repeat-associated protein
VVGRRAEYAPLSSPGTPPVDTAWKLEDRAEILGDDALPAEATYVWDPISDTLVTIASASGDVLRQIIHGGAAYDDPIEVAVNENGVAHRLYPIFDEAGAGTLQAIVNEQGELVSRTVEEDAYGGDEYGLAGAAVDRISVEARKTNGVVESVTVSVRTTEQLDEPSIAEGARLAAVDDSGVVVRSAQTTPQLFENYTLRWTLTAEEWTALTSTANGATRLSIAVTNTLRARAWDGDQPILPAPDAAGMFTSTALPVETRTSFADLTTWIAAEPSNEKVIFEAATLAALAGRTTPASRLIVAAGFQALPFSEPATGLVYARARWYDPSTGSFLTPDPMGYQDSSNLYSFAGGDPVNGRDPSGMSATVGDGGVYVRNDKTGAMYKVTLKQARENTLALQDLLMSEGGYSAQRAKDFLQDMGLKYTHPYQRPVVEKVLPQGDNWFMNGLIATSGLPAQNRQQEIVQGGLQIAGTAAMVLGGTYGNAGGVSEEPVQILSTPSGFSAPISHTLAVEEGWIPKPVSDGRWAKAEEGGRTVYWADDIFEPATRSSWQDPATGRWKRGTNVERMADGLAPIGIDGKSINLHHLLQEEPGALAEAPGTLHNRLPHKLRGRGESFRNDPVLKRQFENYRREYWKQRSKDFQ